MCCGFPNETRTSQSAIGSMGRGGWIRTTKFA